MTDHCKTDPVDRIQAWSRGLTAEDFSGWTDLSFEGRRLVGAIFRLFADGKSRVADSLSHIEEVAARRDLAVDAAPVATTARIHRAGAEFFKRSMALVDRSEADDSTFPDDISTVSREAARIFHGHVEELRQRLDEDASPTHLAASVALLNGAILGVLADTGYSALLTLIERQDILTALREPLETIRSVDRRCSELGHEYVIAMARAYPGIWPVIEEVLNRTYLASVGVVRDLQRRYDFFDVGLVPDEFVSMAIERFQTTFEALRDPLEGPDDGS